MDISEKGTLEITFRGPFVFELTDSGVNVYAPKCEGHHAGIFTANDETPICGRHRHGGEYIYKLSWNDMTKADKPGQISFPKGEYILNGPESWEIDYSEVAFCLQVPRPKTIYPISPSKVKVMPKRRNAPDSYATGLRFYYECDLTKPISLRSPEGRDSTVALDGLPSLPKYADIDVRYVGPDADDAEHLDAIACFERAMKIAKLDWWLYYGQSDDGSLIRVGADCKGINLLLGREMNNGQAPSAAEKVR